jgi:hypothetical protein
MVKGPFLRFYEQGRRRLQRCISMIGGGIHPKKVAMDRNPEP